MRGEDAIVSNAHGVRDAQLLFARFHLGDARVLGKYFAVLRQLASRHERLRDKRTLFAATKCAAADFVARVTHRGVRR